MFEDHEKEQKQTKLTLFQRIKKKVNETVDLADAITEDKIKRIKKRKRKQ